MPLPVAIWIWWSVMLGFAKSSRDHTHDDQKSV